MFGRLLLTLLGEEEREEHKSGRTTRCSKWHEPIPSHYLICNETWRTSPWRLAWTQNKRTEDDTSQSRDETARCEHQKRTELAAQLSKDVCRTTVAGPVAGRPRHVQRNRSAGREDAT